MKTLRIASFGIRGYVGDSLTPGVVMDFASAFATFVDGGRVLLARDTRYSSSMIHSAVVSSLLSAGCEVLDLGVCPTPVLQFCVKSYEAEGAVSITGGHNAMGWNSLTLIGSEGAVLEPIGGENVLNCFHALDFLRQDWRGVGEVRDQHDFMEPYFLALEEHVNAAAIRDAGFTALIDPVGGAGCAYLEPFAARFGFKLAPINAQPSGYLAREAEPRPRSATQMASIIKHLGGDVGFVLSSDMGRMSVVSEDGEPAGEEHTFAVIADHVLGKQAGPIVTNCCTSRMIDDIASRQNAPLVKTSVGQAYVVSALADEQGVLGGEGSGSVVLPGFSRAFDGFLMMALVLEAMAEGKSSISELLSVLPQYHMVKKQVACGSRDGYRALEMLKEQMENDTSGKADLTDGLRVDWDDGWVHVRPSRTEQVVRIVSEARTKEMAEQRAEEIMRIIEREV